MHNFSFLVFIFFIFQSAYESIGLGALYCVMCFMLFNFFVAILTCKMQNIATATF